MGHNELEELFKYLKSISDTVETLKEKISDLKDNFSELKQQVAIMEVNFDNMDIKITEIVPALKEKCKKHEDEIKAATKFIEAQEIKEKALFGIRADVIAWISLVGLLFAIAANYVKVSEAKGVINTTERQVSTK